MKWFNSKTDPLPKDKQSVLIRINDEEFDAVFIEKAKLFICKTKPGQAFSPKLDSFYWTFMDN